MRSPSSSSRRSIVAIITFILVATAVVGVSAFLSTATTTTIRQQRGLLQKRSDTNTDRNTIIITYQQQPNFGDWSNDDFLNSLGGGQPQSNENDNYYNTQQQSPQNELTDEEITQWALRAAQFYNTDASIQEVYGVQQQQQQRREEDE